MSETYIEVRYKSGQKRHELSVFSAGQVVTCCVFGTRWETRLSREPCSRMGMPPTMERGPCTNLLAAVMPWYGWSMEDAVVLSKSAASKLSAYTLITDTNGDLRREERRLNVGDKLAGPTGTRASSPLYSMIWRCLFFL